MWSQAFETGTRPTPATLQQATGETVPLELTVGALCTHRNLRMVQRWRMMPEERPLAIPSR